MKQIKNWMFAAIILFKQHGFQWGGDMPNGNTNYFEKCL